LKFCEYCSENENILHFELNPFGIGYINQKNVKSYYFPDVEINFKNNTSIIIEIKPESSLNDKKVLLKINAARSFIEDNNNYVGFEIITDKNLYNLGEIDEILKKYY